MEQKNVALLIIGLVALIAVIGLIMHFKGANTGGVVHAYPNTVVIRPMTSVVQEFPGAVARGNVQGDPFPYRQKGGADPSMTYAAYKSCDVQARLGNVPKSFIWEASSIQQRKSREAGNTKVCVDAPEQIRPVVACCIPPMAPNY
jgi:hypothetical protein